jgi:hypothetical protein
VVAELIARALSDMGAAPGVAVRRFASDITTHDHLAQPRFACAV